MLDRLPSIAFDLNGARVSVSASPASRLTEVLRDTLGLQGTKVGCNAGDCGACTVLIESEPACACMVPAAQVSGCSVQTVEGLTDPVSESLKRAFLRHGAAQCGICTPGMLVSATALLRENPRPSESEVMDAIGGVLCRCTGYRKIVAAILDHAGAEAPAALPPAGQAVGARIARLDGRAKVDGAEVFGADGAPADALLLRAVRSPHHHARFILGDIEAWRRAHPGVEAVLTAQDVPGENRYGVIPAFADQPVFAADVVRHKGEAVAAVVGEAAVIEALDLSAFPVRWEPLPHALTPDAATGEGAPIVIPERPGNVLTTGRVAKGDPEAALAAPEVVTVSGRFESGFVEHAYIEPEAGFARRVGDRIEVHACTQSPYMDRDDVAKILGIAPEAVRIVPTAVGGGFGSKLDLSVQPFIAVAAWRLGRPVRMVYTRAESIMTTTKRHPSQIEMQVAATPDGKLAAITLDGTFNTGAYASWGPTVANRVPVHGSGPYFVPHYRAVARAIHTHAVPAGAFRGFGVPQSALAQEQLFDELAVALGMDALEFRILNALTAQTPTATGQVLKGGCGIKACFEALRPAWRAALEQAEAHNALGGPVQRGVGVAGMWYGCGNTSMSNPSTIRAGIKADGSVVLHQGAVDIGQGSNTVITQIFADALGVPVEGITRLSADTDITPDCGKTSASRQTFVTGKAAELAGRMLRADILRRANAGEGATIALAPGEIIVAEGGRTSRLPLGQLAPDENGYVLAAEETFDPPTSPLDANGQGEPYAVYGFGAQLAEVEVDTELGTVKVKRIVAAHDVGRAINPTLIEGQIEGGVAQGLGLALMEEFFPGRGENLHDYLIPTVGDMPPVECILVEDAAPVGPFGAKGIGEQALIPTAPAILNAIAHATGVRMTRAPATPDRLRAAILAKGRSPA